VTKRFPIRAKLALALVIPVMAMFAVSIYEVGRANTEASQVRQDTDLAGVALGPGNLIRSLQDERNDSMISAVGLRASAKLPTKSLAASRAVVDKAIGEFRASLARNGGAAQAVYAPALAAFDASVAPARAAYDRVPGKAGLDRLPLSNEMFADYSKPIDSLLTANSRLALRVQDPELRSATEMLGAVSRQIENLSIMVRNGIISSLGGDKVVGTRKSDVIGNINTFQQQQVQIDQLATGPYAGAARGLGKNSSYLKAVELLNVYVNGGALDTTTIVSAVSKRPVPNLDTVTTSTAGALQARSITLRDNAAARQRTFVGLAAGVLILGGAFMLLAARSVTRPLLSLTRQADQMASERLPSAVQAILDTPLGEDVTIPPLEPVKVKTRDEVREVAAALNSVQSSALDLAVEQAVLRRNIADSFVNLGRRTQNLIGRQLDFITELERNETDPAALDNLFKLDHLATRARRNAESLVVLAGLETPRTWTAPIAMGDIVRAALSEVEDYQRVEIRSVSDATIPGRTASDLVHLLAELVENALSFSPPGRPVEVHGRLTRNGYILSVLDHGIGMTLDEIALANDRLAGRESYTVAPSRYLGHYVAGSLAQRIGVTVRLDESPTGGVAAKIVLPVSVLDEALELPSGLTGVSSSTHDDTTTPDHGSTPMAASVDENHFTGPVKVDTISEDARNAASEAPVVTTEHGLHKRVRANVAVSEAGPEPVPESVTPAGVTSELGAEPTAAVIATAPLTEAMAPAETLPVGTTSNGLRKRVPGDQLASTSLTMPVIRRGAGAGEAGPSTDAEPATSVFSALSSFESGAQRGRDDLSSAGSDPWASFDEAADTDHRGDH
jgi:signal transduction histidine kinase